MAVYITNQMTADPGAALSFVADPKKPVGGHILAHASAHRVMVNSNRSESYKIIYCNEFQLKKGRGDMRIAKIYDSPDMPESEAPFTITDGGVNDARD